MKRFVINGFLLLLSFGKIFADSGPTTPSQPPIEINLSEKEPPKNRPNSLESFTITCKYIENQLIFGLPQSLDYMTVYIITDKQVFFTTISQENNIIELEYSIGFIQIECITPDGRIFFGSLN